jgi:excisionase family DNA binding protein
MDALDDIAAHHPASATTTRTTALQADTLVSGSATLPALLTAHDLEGVLRLGRTRVYELLRSGELPVIRVGRNIRVSRDALRRWIDERCS